MVLFTILALTLIILAMLLIFAISIGGSVAIILFGDVIVCIVFIVLIMKKLAKKNKEN